MFVNRLPFVVVFGAEAADAGSDGLRGLIRFEASEKGLHIPQRTVDQNLEMADCCLALVEEAVFHRRQLQRVRMLLKSAKRELNENTEPRFNDLSARLLLLEDQSSEDRS